jgi:hypothetical protein
LDILMVVGQLALNDRKFCRHSGRVYCRRPHYERRYFPHTLPHSSIALHPFSSADPREFEIPSDHE